MSRLVGNGLPASLAAKRILDGLPAGDIFAEPIASAGHQIPLDTILKAVDTFDSDSLSHQLRRLALALPTLDFFDQVIVPLMGTLNSRWTAANPSIAFKNT